MSNLSSLPASARTIPFTKMHGLGNDFVMVTAADLPPELLTDSGNALSELAARVCDRHFGIGADGLIIAAPPTDPDRFDIQFIYYNGDGSKAEMCGNGIRCFALYVRDHNLVATDSMRVETPAGLIQPHVNPDRTVTVNMGQPILEPAKIPFNPGNAPASLPLKQVPLSVLGQAVPVTPISMGNPHCIIFQDDLPTALDPAQYGPAIETHSQWPAKTNVEFVRVLDRQTLEVVVWERGCGFTLACGTGACATAVAGVLCGKSEPKVTIHLPGGPLVIQWLQHTSGEVMMSGPAQAVFSGAFLLNGKTFSNLDVYNQQTAVCSSI
jgi:diaminopimelate epimerase